MNGSKGRGWKIGVLVATAAGAIAWAWFAPRISQDPAYHQFADHRTILGIPNALNVLSNLGFAGAGLYGLWLILSGRATFRDQRERWPWLVLFVGVALTCLGSAWYHLDPSNHTLVWDRLPMAVGFMGLLAALVAERIDPRAGLLLLGPLVLAGLSSVLYWHFTEQAGVGDLRPYYVVQFYPLIAIPMVLVLFPSTCTGAPAYVVALAAYVAAKVAEKADQGVFQAAGFVSGHTLKHLLAAAGICSLAWMLHHRRERYREASCERSLLASSRSGVPGSAPDHEESSRSTLSRASSLRPSRP
jgi:hypothetical protein